MTQFNVTKCRIEYIEQMTNAVGSLMLKLLCIVVQLHTSWSTLTERSISSKMDRPWQTERVYSSKTMHQIYLKFSVNGSLFKTDKKLSLHRRFAYFQCEGFHSLCVMNFWLYNILMCDVSKNWCTKHAAINLKRLKVDQVVDVDSTKTDNCGKDINYYRVV